MIKTNNKIQGAKLLSDIFLILFLFFFPPLKNELNDILLTELDESDISELGENLSPPLKKELNDNEFT